VVVAKAQKAVAVRVLRDFKLFVMKNYNRDLLLLYKTDVFSEDLLQREVECLHQLLMNVERKEVFCRAHELATRSKITNKARSIELEAANPVLKPFHFLINKN
jgi:hypothetical protein